MVNSHAPYDVYAFFARIIEAVILTIPELTVLRSAFMQHGDEDRKFEFCSDILLVQHMLHSVLWHAVHSMSFKCARIIASVWTVD